MKVVFSPRNNGKCPSCGQSSDCQLREDLEASVESLPRSHDTDMEIVVYDCPAYAHQDASDPQARSTGVP